MAARIDAKRVRIPLMEAFRSAHRHRDARATPEVRDEDGERVLSSPRLGRRAAITPSELQRGVARDLERLMNAVHLAADTDLGDFPQIRRSILNHGFVDVARLSIDDIRVDDIGREIAAALRIFEPRLVPETITARRDTAVDPAELKLRFLVRAEIGADPLNVPVEFVADLERDTGRIKVAQR